MYLMLQQDQPDDYVIATGVSHKLEDFVATAFAELNLDWREHLIVDESLFRPTDIQLGKGNPTKACQKLGWQARYQMRDTIRMMIQAKVQPLLNLFPEEA